MQDLGSQFRHPLLAPQPETWLLVEQESSTAVKPSRDMGINAKARRSRKNLNINLGWQKFWQTFAFQNSREAQASELA